MIPIIDLAVLEYMLSQGDFEACIQFYNELHVKPKEFDIDGVLLYSDCKGLLYDHEYLKAISKLESVCPILLNDHPELPAWIHLANFSAMVNRHLDASVILPYLRRTVVPAIEKVTIDRQELTDTMKKILKIYVTQSDETVDITPERLWEMLQPHLKIKHSNVTIEGLLKRMSVSDPDDADTPDYLPGTQKILTTASETSHDSFSLEEAEAKALLEKLEDSKLISLRNHDLIVPSSSD